MFNNKLLTYVKRVRTLCFRVFPVFKTTRSIYQVHVIRHARINSNSRIDILLVLKLFLC